MPSSDKLPTSGRGERLAGFVQRHILWLLIGCYALATFCPEPGLAMRGWELAHPVLGDVPHLIPLLLLALLLFCAALATDLAQARSVLQHPMVLVVGLLTVWLGPGLLVIVAGWIVPHEVAGQATAGLLVGMALVATMPVANSSVGWSQNAGGNLALSLGLVLLSISLSPWTTPHLLGLWGLTLSPIEQALCEELMTLFSGTFFIVWVILPTLAGWACRYLLGSERMKQIKCWLMLTSAATLLLLNYINAALALPKVFQRTEPTLLAATALLAIGLSIIGLAGGWFVARVMNLDDQARSALLFGLSMKHTGLALVLAGTVLAEQPLAMLMIVLATVVQHLLAGVTQWYLQMDSQRPVAEES